MFGVGPSAQSLESVSLASISSSSYCISDFWHYLTWAFAVVFCKTSDVSLFRYLRCSVHSGNTYTDGKWHVIGEKHKTEGVTLYQQNAKFSLNLIHNPLTISHLQYHRLNCQPTTHPTGRAEQGPEGRLTPFVHVWGVAPPQCIDLWTAKFWCP